MTLGITSLIVINCGCRNEKKIKESERSAVTTTSQVLDMVETADQEHITSTVTTSTETSETEESSLERQWKLNRMSVNDMEQALVSVAEEHNVSVNMKTNQDVSLSNGDVLPAVKSYFVTEDFGLIFCREFACEEDAKKMFESVLDYGGWYEESFVDQEIQIEDDHLRLLIYYCTSDEGQKMLFLEGYVDCLAIGLEAWDAETVEKYEIILGAMGIELKA